MAATSNAEGSALRLAVLIDADNAQAAAFDGILAEIARLGEASVKRIYGDFTSQHSAPWKDVLQKHVIKPVQQFSFSTGKNSTDSALIIDAMDLLYSRRFDGFCLVTSDSDFTGLALRIREEGLKVFGFGEQKTVSAFRNACHKFILAKGLSSTEVEPGKVKALQPKAASTTTTKVASAAATKTATEAPKALVLSRKFMLSALEQSSDKNGWVKLSAFGSSLKKMQPDFDFRVYGYEKLSDLVRSRPEIFVTKEQADPGQAQTQLYLQARPSQA